MEANPTVLKFINPNCLGSPLALKRPQCKAVGHSLHVCSSQEVSDEALATLMAENPVPGVGTLKLLRVITFCPRYSECINMFLFRHESRKPDFN